MVGHDDLRRGQSADRVANANHQRVKHLAGTRTTRPENNGKVENLAASE